MYACVKPSEIKSLISEIGRKTRARARPCAGTTRSTTAARPTSTRSEAFGKGRMGSALMGSLQVSCFLTEGPFGHSLPFTYFNLPKSARVYRFPQAVKIRYWCSGPISVDPICPQSTHVFTIYYYLLSLFTVSYSLYILLTIAAKASTSGT